MAASIKLAIVVLAAGEGTRMKSTLPKVLHSVGGRALVLHALDSLKTLDAAKTVVVIGPGMDAVAEIVAPLPVVVQAERKGTADAVKAARPALEDWGGDVLIAYGDTPLTCPETYQKLVDARRARAAAIAVLGFRPSNPGAYGRLIAGSGDTLAAIVEAADATPEQLEIGLCNSGIMAVDGRLLFDLIARIGTANAAGEFYLTDVVAVARAAGHVCIHVEAGEAEELVGVNSRAELAIAEAIFQSRSRAKAMAAGVTLIDPTTVYFAYDTWIGHDVTIEPNVVFGPGVTVAEGTTIRAFCHIQGAEIGPGARIGPFARIRPGSILESGVRIGNFVEVKNARLAEGVKANHLSYLGDAEIGRNANVGAGTITCNYDGAAKHRTELGEGVFVGSNTSLVAPIRIGAGAVIGAGSVITDDVPADALAIARGEQKTVAGGAVRLRKSQRARKAKSDGD